MRIDVVAFTSRGMDLALRLSEALRREGDEVRVAAPGRLAAKHGVEGFSSLGAWAEAVFARSDALVFVSACGIAVRSVSPFVSDKLADPAVVCVDERGGFVVSLLSGHVGGANDLARRVAAISGGQAVVTTATDVEGVFAVDEWAARNNLAIHDREAAKRVSATLLEGGIVGFASDFDVAGELPTGLIKGSDAATSLVGINVSPFVGEDPFPVTLKLVPRVVTIGVGCRRGVPEGDIARAVDACLAEAGLASACVQTLASIEAKRDEEGLRQLASHRGWELRFWSAGELAAVEGEFSSSDFVLQTVGVDNVCERAACAGGGRLVLAKRRFEGVTVALGMREPTLCFDDAHDSEERHEDCPANRRVLTCVGLGPGAGDDMTARAKAALEDADVIVGYTTYIDLIRDAYGSKELVATPMRKEVDRCRLALERASRGERVALVCSGDPGVYGMAGLALELAQDYPGVEVEVVAGVTAANGGAAALGAPLMHDWCSISLSDLMTPWELIERRLEAAAQADFCICLYNPSSRGRNDYLERACDVLLRWRDPQTPCGYVRNIGRDGQVQRILTLAELREAQVDMLTTVFVGNSQTHVVDGRMVTPRGYRTGGA